MPISKTEEYPPGAVVVVPFPFSDRLAEKRRPAVVVSGPAVAKAGYVWIAMITSARHGRIAHDIAIADSATAGLGVASVVRPLKIASIEPNRILRRIGTLPVDTAAEIYASLRAMIGTRPLPASEL